MQGFAPQGFDARPSFRGGYNGGGRGNDMGRGVRGMGGGRGGRGGGRGNRDDKLARQWAQQECVDRKVGEETAFYWTCRQRAAAAGEQCSISAEVAMVFACEG